jgi:hypothetical protein
MVFVCRSVFRGKRKIEYKKEEDSMEKTKLVAGTFSLGILYVAIQAWLISHLASLL